MPFVDAVQTIAGMIIVRQSEPVVAKKPKPKVLLLPDANDTNDRLIAYQVLRQVWHG